MSTIYAIPQASPVQQPAPLGGPQRLSPAAARFFAELYRSARSGCLGALRRCGCSEEEAGEFFAAALERVMRSVDPIARDFAPGQMVTMLKVASMRVLIDERRHRGVLAQVPLEKVDALAAEATASSPAEVTVDREIAAIGREAVAGLGARDRRIFVLRHGLGLSPREIQALTPQLSARAYRRRIEHGNAKVSETFDAIVAGRRCEELRDALRAHARGGARPRQAQEVELHVAHCSGCRRSLAGLRRQGRRPSTRGAVDGRFRPRTR